MYMYAPRQKAFLLLSSGPAHSITLNQPPLPTLSLTTTTTIKQHQEEEQEEDLYTRLKQLQRHLEFVDIQEEYIKDEMKNLKRELIRCVCGWGGREGGREGGFEGGRGKAGTLCVRFKG
jgi:hypothetical protein